MAGVLCCEKVYTKLAVLFFPEGENKLYEVESSRDKNEHINAHIVFIIREKPANRDPRNALLSI